MHKKNEKFLQTFKELEQVLREVNLDVKTYEEQISTAEQEQLRICRQMRNYLSHSSNPDLLIASDQQILFLKTLTINELQKEDIVKKHLKSVAASICKNTDRCTDALQKMIKLKVTQIAIVSKTNEISIVDIYKVAEAVLKSKTSKLSELKGTKNYIFVSPTTKYQDICSYENTVILCTDTGDETGIIKGTVL